MGNGNITIETKEDFLSLPEDERQWMMFRNTDKRLCALEKRKNFDTALSGTTGFFGGALVVWIKSTFIGK